jgi:hypothetical protein
LKLRFDPEGTQPAGMAIVVTGGVVFSYAQEKRAKARRKQSMKTHLLKHAGAISLLLLGVAACPAGPLQRADISNDPAWVLHFDCDALRPTAIGQHIQSEMAKPENDAKLAAFQAFFNFDLRKQLHAVTLYGTGTAPQDGVAIFYADFDAERLTTLAKAARDHQSTTYKSHEIHDWIDDKKSKKGVKARTYAALAGKRVIFGQKEDRVAHALDVIDGASANLGAGQVFPSLGANGAGFIQAAARKLDLPENSPNSALLRLSKVITFDLKEEAGNVNASLTMEANDEEVAGQIASVANGLVSLMKLQNRPEATKLANAISLKQDGAKVFATCSVSAADVVAAMKADAAKKAARKEEEK